MIHFTASGTSGWEWLGLLALAGVLSVVGLLGYVIAGAAGFAKRREKPSGPPPGGRTLFLALVTLGLGALLIMENSSREWARRYDLETTVIVLSAPVLLCLCLVFFFRKKKTAPPPSLPRGR
jgi:hypothetical protein